MIEKILYILDPHSQNHLSKIYEWIMLAAIAIGIFPLMFHDHNTLFIVCDVVSCFCFIIDYVLRWITAKARSEHKSASAFLVYPFTPMAIIDLLSILPTFSLLSPAFKTARFTRLLKILRVVKIIRYFESLEIILSVIRKQKKVLYAVLSMALFYTFLTAIIMFNAEVVINPATGEPLFRDFFDAFYWAVCTLTTVGYGDLYPISTIGRAISIISSLVGIAIIALPSGVITAGYLDEIRERKAASQSAEHHHTNTGVSR